MQGMDHSAMPGMTMPADQGSGQMQGMPGMPDMAMEGMQQIGTALPAGNAPPPPLPTDHAADNVYGSDAMAMGRDHLQQHHGGQNFNQVLLNLAEYQFRNGRDGYRWDGEAWFGGDINRLFVKSEGEGAFREGIESAEVQALYSRAIGPYFNLQAGVRQDLGPSPKRTYATVGVEGLAPGFFELEGALFLSNKGDVLGRLEGYYDQRVTQRLVLQPRVELNFAAQDVPENRIGSGLSNAELGLRLRYEIRREFAPYIGVSWDRQFGDTARYARAEGDKATSRSIVAGVRMWF
jgi:copper resistance protein B